MSRRSRKQSTARSVHKKRTVKSSGRRGLLESLFDWQPIEHKANSKFQTAFWIGFTLMGILLIALSLNSPINADDAFRNYHSDKLILFYTSFGKDTSAFYHPNAPLKYYGGFYEVIAGAVNGVLDQDIHDTGYHNVRHLLNAAFGIIAILFIGLTAVLIGGWPCGFIAILMAFLSPRFSGHSLMNPKDIPFAAGYIMSLFFILKWALTYPKVSTKTQIGLALGFAMAIGVRVGGVLLLFIFGLVVILKAIHLANKKDGKPANSFITMTKLSLIPALAGFLLGLIFWPYGLIDPLHHIPETIKGFSEYFISIRLLFMGDMIYSSQIPFYYLPVWLLVSSPLFVWLGGVVLAFRFKAIWNHFQKPGIWLLMIACVIPLLIAVLGDSSLYDGWRHFLFVYAAFLPLLATGLYFLLENFSGKRWGIVLVVIVGLTFLEPLTFIVRYPSYPYIYFNPLMGGINGAYGQFETDYWGLSVSKAIDWLEEQNLLHSSGSDSLRIATDFYYLPETRIRKRYGDRVRVISSSYRDRDNYNWDYGIFTSRFIPGEHLRQNLWPEKSRLVNTIYAGETPLTVILNNKDDLCFQAHEKYKNGQYLEAVQILNQVLRQYPDNEACWTTLGQTLMQEGQYARAELAYQKALELAPMDDIIYNHIAINYLQQGKDEQGLEAYNRSLEINRRNPMTYYFMALYYRENNDLQRALLLATQCIQADSDAKPCLSMLADLYRRLGNQQQANYFQRLAEQ